MGSKTPDFSLGHIFSGRVTEERLAAILTDADCDKRADALRLTRKLYKSGDHHRQAIAEATELRRASREALLAKGFTSDEIAAADLLMAGVLDVRRFELPPA